MKNLDADIFDKLCDMTMELTKATMESCPEVPACDIAPVLLAELIKASYVMELPMVVSVDPNDFRVDVPGEVFKAHGG